MELWNFFSSWFFFLILRIFLVSTKLWLFEPRGRIFGESRTHTGLVVFWPPSYSTRVQNDTWATDRSFATVIVFPQERDLIQYLI